MINKYIFVEDKIILITTILSIKKLNHIIHSKMNLCNNISPGLLYKKILKN